MPKKRTFELSPLPLEAQAALQALGAQLAIVRKERGYSQRSFSDIAEVSLPTLVKWNRERHQFRSATTLVQPGCSMSPSLP